jgi:PAS domain S-box-containing protein
VHPDDLAFVHREKKSAAEGLRRVKFEHRVIRPNGEVRYVHQITEMILDDQGRPARESGTMQDISERKVVESALRQSEERFKFVARAVSDVVWDWDLSANTLWWNDGFLTIFGFAAGEIEPSVESWTNRIHPDERTRVVDSMHHAIDAGAESWSAEYRFQRKDGSYASVQDCGFILRDVAGKAVRMVGGMRDWSSVGMCPAVAKSSAPISPG